MERTRQVFSKLGLKRSFSLGRFDTKHMLICMLHEGDFNRIYLKILWFIDGFPMRIFRWSPDFRPDVQSSIAPIWISLPNLLRFLFDKKFLFSIGELIGNALTLDFLIMELSHPSMVRLCIEVDLLKCLLHRIWLECGQAILGFWQEIIYKKGPHCCGHCRRLGHDVSARKLALSQLANKPKFMEKHIVVTDQYYRKKIIQTPNKEKKKSLEHNQSDAVIHSTETVIDKEVPFARPLAAYRGKEWI